MDMPEVKSASNGTRRRQISEPSTSVVIERPGYAAALLAQLDLLRSDTNSADTVLIAEGKKFPCHRALLSASSQYFRLMFGGRLRESHERSIEFDGVTALALGRIVDFVYSGLVKVTVDDAQELLAAACLFQYSEIVDECCSFLSAHLHPTNCLAIEAFAQLHSCSQLEQEARKFAKENFAIVALESDEFLELSAQRLESYVSNNDIEVRLEEAVFEAVVRWVGADADARRSVVCCLMRHIRFAFMASDYLTCTVLPHYLIASCQSCSSLVAEAGDARSQRPSTIAKEVIVVVGGCDNCGSVLDSVEAYVPSKDRWQPLPSVPVAVSNCSVAAVGNDIFVSGGIVKGDVVSAVWRFVSAQQQWMPACTLLAPRAYHASAAVGTRLYVVGGNRLSSVTSDASVVETIECIDVDDANCRWLLMGSVPSPRQNSHMVAFGDEMLVEVGGLQVGAGIMRTIETYACHDNSGYISYSGEQFVLPDTILHAQVAAIGGILYIIWTDTTRVISLNSERRVFRRLADLRHRHVEGRATVLGGRVYITGGSTNRNPEDVASDIVEYYDTESDRWTDVRPMLSGRRGHGCVTICMR